MQNVHIVTGGSGGMGLETAKQFAEGIVLITDINEESLNKGKQELEGLGITVKAVLCDISNREQIQSMLKEASELGNIRNVVNTAGISASVPNVKLIINVDLLGTAILLEELEPYIQENTSVICLASMMGYTVDHIVNASLLLNSLADGAFEKIISLTKGDPSLAYNIAKRGVQLLCEQWAYKYGLKGGRINSVSPGIVETKMAVEANKKFPGAMKKMQDMTPLGRNAQPKDIVNLIMFLASDSASFITGTDILIDGGLIKNLMQSERAKVANNV